MTDMRCIKCGASFRRAVLLALAIDAGVKTNIDPSKCQEGGYHDFCEGAPLREQEKRIS